MGDLLEKLSSSRQREISTISSLRPCNVCGEHEMIRLLYHKRGYSIVQCKTCSLVYVNELPSRVELDTIYSADFFQVGTKFTRHSQSPNFLNAQERVKRLMSLPGVGLEKWLDVGCATGDFVSAAKPFVAEANGIEISHYAASQAQARGAYNVFVGDFLEVDVGTNQYDVVSMWDFIEHVRDPTANLQKAFDVLKPGGYLVLSTGNIESAMAKLTGRFWHLMIPPRHLHFFSPSTIRYMLTAAGFNSISIVHSGKRVPLDFVIWKLTYLAHQGASNFVLRLATLFRLGKIAPIINLGDIMTVYACKAAT